MAEAERKLVLRIPPVVRLGPILVQPQTVLVVIQVEDVRVAVPVGLPRTVLLKQGLARG